ncbi:hypothetical protein GCM10019016_111810 [Streptomyces prasinosporus]|uniref:Uncharacterized protein n=1 Tax=Streptomyces prasinosporus TaxID=68256 RepID=A0ABP6UBG4_9ACTN|nr:hypothetical protein GCM10010332_23780 [Streptomyces albogriseolus]
MPVRGHGYRADVSNSYATLWTNDLCRELERSGYAGRRLTMLFGGPHQSLPSFQRAGVQPGDRIYPVRAHRTRLHVLGVLEVARIVPYENAGSALPDDDYVKLLDWRPLKTGCVTEVLIGPPGAPLRFDTVVPGGLLERLTYTSRRGERLLKHVEDGRLTRSTSLQGIYRLAADSAEELDQLIRHEAPSGGADEV